MLELVQQAFAETATFASWLLANGSRVDCGSRAALQSTAEDGGMFEVSTLPLPIFSYRCKKPVGVRSAAKRVAQAVEQSIVDALLGASGRAESLQQAEELLAANTFCGPYVSVGGLDCDVHSPALRRGQWLLVQNSANVLRLAVGWLPRVDYLVDCYRVSCVVVPQVRSNGGIASNARKICPS